MKKILLIKFNPRLEYSRTEILTKYFINAVKDKFMLEIIDLNDMDLKPKTKKDFVKGEYNASDECIALALKVANADKIVFAAPFWDMSIPSALKIFIERVSIGGITFDDGSKQHCKANEILLITTRGLDIKDYSLSDGASSYLKALGILWGIPGYNVISSSELDIIPIEEINSRLLMAKKEIDKLISDWSKEI